MAYKASPGYSTSPPRAIFLNISALTPAILHLIPPRTLILTKLHHTTFLFPIQSHDYLQSPCFNAPFTSPYATITSRLRIPIHDTYSTTPFSPFSRDHSTALHWEEHGMQQPRWKNHPVRQFEAGVGASWKLYAILLAFAFAEVAICLLTCFKIPPVLD
ncbi:hypothetical protein BKA61DRAFT_167079 [Leptodontidium sp. MPI-SDFR-AT-0119]|nr:hypothetical protein BKA61DRAFT_167079 [Leptodontidium sp. MPI-SDFR-AT-0119]